MSTSTQRELRAFLQDTYGFYYFRRGKYAAALAALRKAMRVHTTLGQLDHVAKVHLHTAVILSRMRNHAEAVRVMGQVRQGGGSVRAVCSTSITL